MFDLFNKKEDPFDCYMEIHKKVSSFYRSKLKGTNNYKRWGDYTFKIMSYYSEAVYMTRDEMKEKYGKSVVYRREKFLRDLGFSVYYDFKKRR